jgi:hypothetical protein
MPGELKIFCNSCKQSTNHSAQRTFEQVLDETQIVEWQIIQCLGCESVSFRENRLINVDLAASITSESIYPPRKRRQIKQFDGIPEKLDRIYREMITSLHNGEYILCAGGLRALVEGICAQQNITDGPKRDDKTGEYEMDPKTQQIKRGKTLGCKTEGLAEKHLLTEPQASALHQHRYLGNAALHELEVPSDESLNIAISIIENAMDTLYNIPAQATNLNRMRANIRYGAKG